MGKKPAKPVAKKARRALPPPRKAPLPKRAAPLPEPRKAPLNRKTPAPSQAPDISTTDAEKSKRYVEQRMKEWATSVDLNGQCYIWMTKPVNIANAIEWAAYWSPRIGTPIRLAFQTGKDDKKKWEHIIVDHVLASDPFPQRAIDYPWKVTEAEAMANRKQWYMPPPVAKEPPAAVEGEPPNADAKAVVAAPQGDSAPGKPPGAAKSAPQPSAAGKAATGKVRRTVPSEQPAAPGARKNPRPGTKAFAIVAACERKQGATKDEIVAANDGTWPGDAYLRKLAGIAKLDLSVVGNKWFMKAK